MAPAARPCAGRSKRINRCSACTAIFMNLGGVVKIGRTTSVNPGSEYGEGVLRGCLLTLARDEVKNYQLTAG